MTLPEPIIISAIAAGAAIFGSMVTILTARIMTGPGTSEAQTHKFTALIDRQETERKALIEEFEWRTFEQAKREEKLERVASDLEAMVVRLIEWGDEVTIVATRRGVKLPPRPKFPHVVTSPATG